MKKADWLTPNTATRKIVASDISAGDLLKWKNLDK
jgi:hypothetical protein